MGLAEKVEKAMEIELRGGKRNWRFTNELGRGNLTLDELTSDGHVRNGYASQRRELLPEDLHGQRGL